MNEELVNFRHHMVTAEEATRMAQKCMMFANRDYDYRTDPDYYAADRIRAKRQARLKP